MKLGVEIYVALIVVADPACRRVGSKPLSTVKYFFVILMDFIS